MLNRNKLGGSGKGNYGDEDELQKDIIETDEKENQLTFPNERFVWKVIYGRWGARNDKSPPVFPNCF